MAERKVTASDFKNITEYVMDEYERRRKNRGYLERVWKEVDRQLDMKPDVSHKLLANGTPDVKKAWMPEVELPLQAEAHETLVADTRGMMFPDTGPWFTSHSCLTDKYLEKAEFTSIITGDDNDVPSRITQDAADKLVAGAVTHWQSQYDFRGYVDLINAQAFAYGTGCGRARLVKKSVYMDTARGVVKEDQTIPMLVPTSIKQTYLDDREHILAHEGFAVGPLQIFCKRVAADDLRRQAAAGGSDMNAEMGGWIAKNVQVIEGDKEGMVELVEAEGDLLIPRRTTEALFLPGVHVWVAKGKGDKQTVIRVKFRKMPYPTLIVFPYHREYLDSVYSTSPLIKGWPLQAAATEALMRIMESAALSTQPPVSYDRNDRFFALHGGPIVAPGAQWSTTADVVPHQIGNPVAMMEVYTNFLLQYADVVGMHRARLGAQTVSHTTAYAKNVELQRGAVRTVDYVRQTLQGPLAQWLHLCYELGRDNMKGKHTFYIEAYRGWVSIEKDHLPPDVVFEAHGSGGPADENARKQERMGAIMEAIQIDAMNVQMGGQPKLNLEEVIKQRLLEGGWADIDPFLNKPTPQSAMPVPGGAPQGAPGGQVPAAAPGPV